MRGNGEDTESLTVSARLVSSVLIFADSDERLESEGDLPRNTRNTRKSAIAQGPLPRAPRVPRFPSSESLSTKHSSRRDPLSVWSSSVISGTSAVKKDKGLRPFKPPVWRPRRPLAGNGLASLNVVKRLSGVEDFYLVVVERSKRGDKRQNIQRAT